MKKIAVLFFSIVLLIGCKESNNKNEKILSESSGRLNSLSIVIDNELWEGQVGENLREKLAAPVDGLPQQEPLFSLNQIPPKAFSGFAARNRTFLYIKNSQSANFEVVKDTMAKPQTGIYISGATPSEINKVINENTEKIIQTYKKAELKEQQRFDKKLKEEETWIRQGIKARRTRNEGRVRALKQMREEREMRRDSIGQAKITNQAEKKSGKM